MSRLSSSWNFARGLEKSSLRANEGIVPSGSSHWPPDEDEACIVQALAALRSAFEGLAVRDCSGAVLEVEVVEVKNACPYRQVSAVTRKGRVRPSYILADPGPAQKVRSQGTGTGGKFNQLRYTAA